MMNQFPLDTWPYHERIILASGTHRFHLEDTMNNFESKLSIKLDVHGFVHRNKNIIERTDKMRPCSRIYYSSVS
jgi:hypothetical protein